jgi:hypothetical protein
MALPRFSTKDQALTLLQSNWSSQIDPVLAFPPNKGFILQGVSLSTGVNVINHKLARKPQGYIITDIDAAATIFRSAPLNDTTLTLTSNADAVASIWVF